MTDIVNRLREVGCEAEHDARAVAEAADEIERLRAENFSLAAWQCEFTDGKTGLVAGEGGSTYCAMAKEVERLKDALLEIRDAGPRTVDDQRWRAAKDALEGQHD